MSSPTTDPEQGGQGTRAGATPPGGTAGRPVRTLVDSCVLIDVLGRDARWYEWSAARLYEAGNDGAVAINPAVYAELAYGYEDRGELDGSLPDEIVRLDLGYEAAWLAGQAHRRYRERGGERTSPLADFYIGGTAQEQGLRLLTRDAARFRTYFPAVELVVP